jgi:hypothetical protein
MKVIKAMLTVEPCPAVLTPEGTRMRPLHVAHLPSGGRRVDRIDGLVTLSRDHGNAYRWATSRGA